MFGSILMILILIALLMIVSLVQYSFECRESASPQKAQWSFEVNRSSIAETKEIALLDMQGQVAVKERKIAPGFYGEVELEFDATDSEVDVEYCVEAIEKGKKPDNLVFYAIMNENKTAYYSTLNELVKTELKGTILKSENNQVKNAVICCSLPFETENDAQITAEENSYDYTFSLKVVGTEKKTTTQN